VRPPSGWTEERIRTAAIIRVHTFLRLNRPAVLNALDPELLIALLGAVDELDADAEVRSAILAGEGRAFCAGGDLTAMLRMQHDEFRDYIALLQRLRAVVRGSPKPFVAALHGHVLAGGFELALLCDIRIASNAAASDRRSAPEFEMDREVACFQTDVVQSNLQAFAHRPRRSTT
jgi:enoyl-CoA hydratase/carnithine racemase